MLRVQPGQKLNIRAADWNDCLAAADAHKRGMLGTNRADESVTLPPGILKIKNNSGTDRSRFEILGLGDPVYTPTDNLAEFKNNLAFKGETVAFASHFGKFVVLLTPTAGGKFGYGMIQGVCNVQIDVKDADHEYADIENATHDTLRSYCAGSARILWKQAGTGDKWARVLLGNQAVKLWRFTMNEDFSGSPSSADSDLLNIDGSDTGQDVDVYDRLSIFSADLSSGDAGWCCQMGSTFHAIQAPCP